MSMSGRLAALQEANAAEIQALANEGIQFDPLMLLKQRLDVVTDFTLAKLGKLFAFEMGMHLAPNLSDELEMEWERSVEDILSDARAQVDAAEEAGGHGHGTQLSIPDAGLILPD